MTQRYGFGSSPLARGLRGSSARTASPPGIIPARAGFTGGPLGLSFSLPDHPRSRGVYPRIESSKRFSIGSSPLARGLRRGLGGGGEAGGIIPARAGFTLAVPEGQGESLDHPRSRGVYSVLVANFPYNEGSSPLARGLRMTRFQRSKHTRIIPARAGFTGASWPHSTCESDHPRSRGVYN